jgi:hypothetical protein
MQLYELGYAHYEGVCEWNLIHPHNPSLKAFHKCVNYAMKVVVEKMLEKKELIEPMDVFHGIKLYLEKNYGYEEPDTHTYCLFSECLINKHSKGFKEAMGSKLLKQLCKRNGG